MNRTQQTLLAMPADRRLQIDLPLPDGIAVGKAEMIVLMSPAREEKSRKPIRHLAGWPADNKTFAGDSVELQRAMRDEW